MIRKTLDTDTPAVMAIYDVARAFMRAHGNATQWPEGTPSAEQLAADIDVYKRQANNLPKRDRFILVGFIWANVKGRPRRCAIGPF